MSGMSTLRATVVQVNRLPVSSSSLRNTWFDSLAEGLDGMCQKLFLQLFVCLLFFLLEIFRTGSMQERVDAL